MRTDWMARLHHRRMQSRLSAFHSGELSPEQLGQVQEHLASCRECRATIDRYSEAERALTTARPEPDALSTNRVDSIYCSALHASRCAPRRHPLRLAAGLSLAAAAGLGIALWIFHRPSPETGPAPFNSARTETKHVKEKRLEVTNRDFSNYPVEIRRIEHPFTPHFSGKRRPRTSIAYVRHPRRRRSEMAFRLSLAALKETRDFNKQTDKLYESGAYTAGGATGPVGEIAPQESTGGRLVVIVTGSEPRRLSVEVTAGATTAIGFAKVSAVAPDNTGNGFISQCTIRQDEESESTVTTQYWLVAGEPVSRLTVETNQPVEKSLLLEKGTTP